MRTKGLTLREILHTAKENGIDNILDMEIVTIRPVNESYPNSPRVPHVDNADGIPYYYDDLEFYVSFNFVTPVEDNSKTGRTCLELL
ncbi:hypothetical protein bpr_II058 (plasmid) [Butyrivibrio proteoclasticus B316]|uniref:Uncharacterized protein n=1 Tax=Butyrivibrio proteoclasticus (strain ATCC 51982 / DSM 14932 / B316) TaxID=515622 RepID=E0S3L6_BUTPB|nr:hypothetical protein [Butyrivibrio proteoclasticus]ADL35998.1 hypothetical protein bpr_II058 [Butyrivibrio proteoclasticus B316]